MEVSDNQLKLYNLASQFRQAVILCDKSKLPLTLRNFPRGSCGDTSRLLSIYLSAHGYKSINYVCGRRDDWSHAWLEVDGFIIDITASQFSEIKEIVIITMESDWHKQWEVYDRDRHPVDIEDYLNPKSVNNYSESYAEILQVIQN